MIKNSIIIEKIKDKTKNDESMQNFLLDILNHENENSQYTKEYEKLIDKALKERFTDYYLLRCV